MNRLLLICLLAPGLSLAGEKPHPSLVDPATAKCETCHAELLKGRVHPVLEMGCDNCHAFSKKEGKLAVGLSMEGTELCAQCHEEQAGRAALVKPHMPIDDCSSCHVPHASEQAPLLNSALPDLCLGCHDKDETRKKHGDQPVHATTCVVCHDPHGNDRHRYLARKEIHPPFGEGSCSSCHRTTRTRQARLSAKVPDLCFACHADLEEGFKGATVHGPVAKGECTKCHDPHMSGQAKLVKARSPNLCYGCHPAIEKAVKAKAHEPAKDDCGTCHGTHATGRPHLLLGDMMVGPDIASLCVNCHADNESWKAKHLGAGFGKLDCAGCHDPHGSAQKHLLSAASVHPPFTEGCENCHAEGTALAEQDPDLCFMCHDDVKEAAAAAAVPHAALEMGCASCHSPHASNQSHLIKGPPVQVCGECHSMDHPVYHGIIHRVGCQACHEPHGGNNPKLLKKTGNVLCLDCHSADAPDNPVKARVEGRIPVIGLNGTRTAGHPVLTHPVTGKPRGKRPIFMPKGMAELSCLSCHDPHGGRTPDLFAFDKGGYNELCAVCHKK